MVDGLYGLIPKRIVQFWVPRGDAPKQVQLSLLTRAVMSNLRLLNPDFEYVFFYGNEVQQFVDDEFPEYRDVFNSFRFPIQKFDFFRYLAVYRYGGFYFDLDVLLAEGLTSLVNYGCVFPFEGLTLSRLLRNQCNMDWQIANYAFGAAPGHPFLKAVIENCIRAQNDPDWVKPMMQGFPLLFRNEYLVLNSTGPGLISRTLGENRELARTVKVLFPDGDVCDLSTWNHFGNVGVHLMHGSWRAGGGWLRRRLARSWQDWTFRQLMKESIALGRTRHHPPQSIEAVGNK